VRKKAKHAWFAGVPGTIESQTRDKRLRTWVGPGNVKNRPNRAKPLSTTRATTHADFHYRPHQVEFGPGATSPTREKSSRVGAVRTAPSPPNTPATRKKAQKRQITKIFLRKKGKYDDKG
jgi:hypothetical protein